MVEANPTSSASANTESMSPEEIEALREKIDLELQQKIVNLQKGIKKLKVQERQQELSIDLIKKVCFTQSIRY